jgi:hypothetical protein
MNIKDIVAKLGAFGKPKGPVVQKSISPGLVFSGLSLLVLLADIWVAQSAVRVVYQYKFADVGARTVQSTRVNFQNYDQAIERIEGGDTYTPNLPQLHNPFLALKKP